MQGGNEGRAFSTRRRLKSMFASRDLRRSSRVRDESRSTLDEARPQRRQIGRVSGRGCFGEWTSLINSVQQFLEGDGIGIMEKCHEKRGLSVRHLGPERAIRNFPRMFKFDCGEVEQRTR